MMQINLSFVIYFTNSGIYITTISINPTPNITVVNTSGYIY